MSVALCCNSGMFTLGTCLGVADKPRQDIKKETERTDHYRNECDTSSGLPGTGAGRFLILGDLEGDVYESKCDLNVGNNVCRQAIILYNKSNV